MRDLCRPTENLRRHQDCYQDSALVVCCYVLCPRSKLPKDTAVAYAAGRSFPKANYTALDQERRDDITLEVHDTFPETFYPQRIALNDTERQTASAMTPYQTKGKSVFLRDLINR